MNKLFFASSGNLAKQLFILLWGMGFLFTAACRETSSDDPADLAPLPTGSPPAHIAPYGGDDFDTLQQRAAAFARHSGRLLTATLDQESGQPLRSEIFGAYPARASDVQDETAVAACAEQLCYRVDVYNYATNTAVSLIVNMQTAETVQLTALRNVQPEIPPHLAEKAVKIARRSPQVAAELGVDPDNVEPTMPNVKTALNDTACEQSRHLCAAPTFITPDRALWVIVDLTAEEVVGVRWTELGASAGVALTEQTILFEDLYAEYCDDYRQLERSGWAISYILTSSDGLEIADVAFNGDPVLDSAKIVDWHVNYSADGFGYSDGTGCPIFSSASVVAHRPPEIVAVTDESDTAVGFAIRQDYAHPQWPQPCNYRYRQTFEFYNDGRFRVIGTNLGRGCGTNGTYRPIFRLQWPTDIDYTLEEWTGTDWRPWAVEQWRLQTADTAYTAAGYQYRLRRADGRGYALEPGQGQFPHGGPGDNAYLYLTRYRPDEGETDLLTLGSCCNVDYQQGPETFIDSPPEETAGRPLVTWYVPQMANSNQPGRERCWADTAVVDGLYEAQVWPCSAGPLFVPLQN